MAVQFDVSVDSIRRDLSIMEEDQLLQRTHGGAIPPPMVRTGQVRMKNDLVKAHRAKIRLPKKQLPILIRTRPFL